MTSFVVVLAMFICIFGVGAHAIYCPNDTSDSRIITKLFAQPWLFLFGYSGFAEFVGIDRYSFSLMDLLYPVYTIQPVVKPVVQPV